MCMNDFIKAVRRSQRLHILIIQQEYKLGKELIIQNSGSYYMILKIVQAAAFLSILHSMFAASQLFVLLRMPTDVLCLQKWIISWWVTIYLLKQNREACLLKATIYCWTND